MSQIKYNYIIYHKNCFDGFTGLYFFLKTKQWEPKAYIYPDTPYSQTIPPNIKDKNVIIIDVAYSPNIIKEIAKQANKMLFIDHHVTIKKEVDNLNIKAPHELIYDDNASGASLVWKYFYKNKNNMPRFLKYIEDNDTGTWQYPETVSFISALEVNFILEHTHQNLRKWDNLLNDQFLDKLINKGEIYNKYKNYLILKNSKQATVMPFPSEELLKLYESNNKNNHMIPYKYQVAVINGGCPSASLLGKYVAENIKCDFCFIYHHDIRRNKYVISLRSNKTDVGTIAKIFGGGGHKFASAFSLNACDINIRDCFG